MAELLRACTVHQLDAQQLDTEIMRVLTAQWRRVFAHVPRALVDSVEPELGAILRLLVWRLSVWSRARTPGQALQNLTSAPLGGAASAPRAAAPAPPTARASAGQGERARRDGEPLRAALLDALLSVLLPWLLARLRALAAARRWADCPRGCARQQAWRALHAAEGAERWLQLLSTAALLRFGAPYSPRHWLRGTRVRYALIGAPALTLPFEFVGQHALWIEITQLARAARAALGALPTRAHARGLVRGLVRPLRRALAARALALRSAGPGRGAPAAAAVAATPAAAAAELRCAFCGTTPAGMPCVPLARNGSGGAEGEGGCGHVHCYACLRAAIDAAGGRAECAACGADARGLSRRLAWAGASADHRGSRGEGDAADSAGPVGHRAPR